MRGLLFSDAFRGKTVGSQDGGRWLAKSCERWFHSIVKRRDF